MGRSTAAGQEDPSIDASPLSIAAIAEQMRANTVNSQLIAAVPPSSSDEVAPYSLRRGLLLSLVSILLGLTQSLGIFLVNNNLTAIQGSLGATAAEASWLATAYFATALSATALLTKVRLQFGLRPFALWGILIYLCVGIVHLIAPDLPSALIARAALGLAATPLTTLAILYMVEAFPKPLATFGLTLGFATLQFGAPLSRILSESLLKTASWKSLQLFDLALAIACLGAISAVSLTPPPLMRVLRRGDALSFLFYSAGLALICVVCTQGRLYWWTDTPWLGFCLATAIGCLGLYVLVELAREDPLLDLRWICSPPILTLIATVLLFRIVLSEQPIGAITLMNTLGFTNDQMHDVFTGVVMGTMAGFGLSLLALPTQSFRSLALIALTLIVGAALLDANSTALTRPDDLILSQSLLAAGTAMFLSSTLLSGFLPVIQAGLKNVVSFFAVFSASQMLGNLLGSAVLSTFLADRQKMHYAGIVESLVGSNPQVASRLAQGAANYGPHVSDPIQRGMLGTSALAQQATRESFVLAYNDLFQLIAVVAAFTLAWLSILSLRQARRAAAERNAIPPPLVPMSAPPDWKHPCR